MTNEPSKSQSVLAANGDLVRVVPLYGTQERAAAATPAQLTFHNGPLLSAVEVFTIFWGSAWEQQSDLMNNVNQFFDFILTSPLIDQLAEYNVNEQQIVHGHRSGTITITSPKLHHSVTDSAIQHMLQQEISSNAAFPQPTPNTLYFVYLPPQVTVVQGGGPHARYSVDITTISAARSFTRSCLFPIVMVARAPSRNSMHSPRPVHTSCAKRSRMQFPDKVGMMTPTTRKLAISAPGRPRRLVITPSSSSGRTQQVNAFNSSDRERVFPTV